MFNITRNICFRILTVKDFCISNNGVIINNVNLQCINKSLGNDVKMNFGRNLSSTTFGSDDKVDGIDYEAITNGDKELEHKLKIILLEAEVLRQEGKRVPTNEFLTVEHWKEALNLSRIGRIKYFDYLFKIMKKKENRKIKQSESRKVLEEVRKNRQIENTGNESIEEFAMKYDLQHNNFLIRVRDTTMNRMYNNRLIQAIQFGQKLVVDCGYDNNMTIRENKLCAKQLMLLFAENRQHDDPSDLHFCNFKKDTLLYTGLHKYIPTLEEPDFPLNIHECSYLDLFPQEQLIYLTPHTRDEMLEYDHDAIYIVGGVVDKVNNDPLSLAKAKKEGLKMLKFPLDRYLQWGGGSGKSLTLNQVVSILNDLKVTGNWEHALRHVPKRKIVDFSMQQNLEKKSSLRYDKLGPKSKWIPSAKVDFENLNYKPQKTNNRLEKGKLIKSLFE